MSEQQYTYDGRAGCVMRHKSRATGTTIGIYKADQAGLDGRNGEWIAICEEHGERYAFPNLRHAQKNYAGAPWCSQCHPSGVPGVPASVPPKPPRPKSSPYVGLSTDGHIRINYQLYERLGSPSHFQVQWESEREQLIITASSATAGGDNRYPVRQARRVDGTSYGTGRVTALAPIRASGLAPGRYQPKVVGNQVILKARFKLAEPADETEGEPPAPAQP